MIFMAFWSREFQQVVENKVHYNMLIENEPENEPGKLGRRHDNCF
jgi:hypothetical protein